MLHDVERYLVARRQAGVSSATLRQYEWHLRRMVAWFSDRAVMHPNDVDREAIRRWGASLYDGWSPATIKQAVCAARSFFSWLHEEGELAIDPSRALRVPHVPRRVQRAVTAEEVRAMMGGCDLCTPKGVRDLALLHVLVDTGLRASEVCRLMVAGLDLEGRVLAVTIKGGNGDVAYFGHSTAARLRAWLPVRAAVAALGVEALFVATGGGRPGHPLTTRGLRVVVKRIGERVGVAGVSPHAFRRGFACIATAAGAPSRLVQQAGRWSNIGMVEYYTRSLQRGQLYRHWSPADQIAGDVDP